MHQHRQPHGHKMDRALKQASPVPATGVPVQSASIYDEEAYRYTQQAVNVPGIGRNKRLMVSHAKLKQPSGKDQGRRANKGQTVFKNYGASSSGNSGGSKKSSSNGSKGS